MIFLGATILTASATLASFVESAGALLTLTLTATGGLLVMLAGLVLLEKEEGR